MRPTDNIEVIKNEKQEGVIRVLLSLPNEGHTQVEAYANRMTNMLHLGKLEGMQEYEDSKIKFQFFSITLGRMLVSVAREEAAKVAIEADLDYVLFIDDDMICFRGDSLVETENGAKKIRDIKVGERVKTHLGHFKPVEEAMKRLLPSNKRDLVFVYTNNSLTKCTPNHKFLVDIDTWKEASELTTGDTLLYPVTNKDDLVHIGNETHSISPELARLFGLYCAEGYGNEYESTFAFNNNEVEYHNFVIEALIAIFGVKPKKYTRHATEIKFSSKPISVFLQESFGTGAINKHIPDFIFEGNELTRLHFIKGLMEGDGNFTDVRAQGAALTTVSKTLAEDFYKLCQKTGLEVCPIRSHQAKRTYFAKENRYINSKEFYRVKINAHSWYKLLDLCEANKNGDYLEIPIKAVTFTEADYHKTEQRYVYNLQVTDDRTYIVNSAIVHNCPDNLFELLWRHDVDIVAPLAFTRNYPHHPVLYQVEKGWDKATGTNYYINHFVDKYPRNKLVQCDAVGFGAALIKVDVFKKIPPPWFISSTATGEDIAFCNKAVKCGFKIHMDTSTKLGHLSHPPEITEALVDSMNIKREEPIYSEEQHEVTEPKPIPDLIRGD